MRAAGLMHPSGLAKIRQAKRDGSWTLFDDVEALRVPKELSKALASHENARANFDAFPPSRKKAILGWITLAKRPETRAKRIAEAARGAAENRRSNAWVRKEK